MIFYKHQINDKCTAAQLSTPAEARAFKPSALRIPMELTKEQSRKRWKELRTLVNDWDPLGLISMGAPDDEYECLLSSIIRQLQSSAKPELIAKELVVHIEDHFGHPPDFTPALVFVNKAVLWFNENWREPRI